MAIAVIVPKTVLAILPSTPTTRCAAVREIRVCPERGAVILGGILVGAVPGNIVPYG